MSEFKIDPNLLDHECLQQPDLVWQYSRGLANAKKKMEQVQEDFEAFKIALETRIRNHPEKYKIVKLTEGSVKAAMKGQEKYAELQRLVKEQQYELDLAWADVHAINSKQQSLTDLVKLHGQGYFSEVKTTKEGVDAILKDKARKKGGVRRKENES